MTVIQTTRGTVTIRLSSPNDAESYRALRLQALRDHPEAFGSDYETNLSHPLEFWQQRLTPNPTAANYVAVTEAGKVVGMTAIRREELIKLRHNGSIQSVYVHPEWRGMGIMDALMTACLNHAREQGIVIVKLSVTNTNASAIRVYLRHGFSVYGVDPMMLYLDGIYYDELLMAKRL